MPHQEHLSQAGGELPHRRGSPGAHARLVALIAALRRAALWLLLCAPAWAQTALETAPPLHVEAVRASGWHDAAPPGEGWTPVTLPDTWTTRWPGFDGVVWYRIRWEQPADRTETGLLLRYLNMAGAVWLNGTPIGRDASLVEPLTRSWNTPQHWLLAPPVLRPGHTNTLLVRVSGLAAYQPGLGPVQVGAPATVHSAYEGERLMRRDLQILGLAFSGVVASFFAVLWVLRRRESAYGWFALMSFIWLVYGLNQIVTRPWPFATTDGWQAFSTGLLASFSFAFAIFIFRFCGLRLRRTERVLGLLALACWLDLWWVAPDAIRVHRDSWILAAVLLSIGVSLAFLALLARRRNNGTLALAPFMAVSVVAAIHDLLVYLQVIDSNIYYTALSSYGLVFGMALVLAGRFVQNLRRIENFNTELLEEVSAAKAELASTLAQRHALELAHARIGERVNLASDLHDGLGGMLVGSIATLEHSPEALTAPELLAMLKQLRDDLRLIIDAAGRDDGAPQSFGELLAPLRHRVTQLLDANGIDCRWQLAGIDGLALAPSQSLDLLRLLQEALTNVVKHSGGRRVDVRLQCTAAALDLTVQDDGHGFAPEAHGTATNATGTGTGTGLRSMRARARRLGGELTFRCAADGTCLMLRMPLGPEGDRIARPVSRRNAGPV